MTRSSNIATALVFAVLASGCTNGTADDAAPANPTGQSSIGSTVSPSQPAISSSVATPTTPGITITTGASEFGTMLFDTKDQAIYIWEVEESTTPRCYGDCAELWPPVLTTGAPTGRGEVKSGLLGTTERRDGTTQVTYNGHPLYYYAHEGPGEVKCHNISTHGGRWWVIKPNGDRAA